MQGMTSLLGCWLKISRRYVIIGALFINAILVSVEWHSIRNREIRKQKELEKELRNLELLRPQVEAREAEIREIKEYYYATLQKQKKEFPAAIGIGVKKCGTDGLIRFLGHHPLVRLPMEIDTEAFFFNRMTSNQTLEDYRNLFPPINDREMTIEKTPQYFDDLPYNLPEIIATSLPGIKLLLIVCEPAKRVYSEFVHEKHRSELDQLSLVDNYATFDRYVNDVLTKVEKEMTSLMKRKVSWQSMQKQLSSHYKKKDLAPLPIMTGLYFIHVQRWLKAFNRTNLMIVDGERFLADPGAVVEEMLGFLGLPKLVWKEDFVKNQETGFFCFRKLTPDYLDKKLSGKAFAESLKCLTKTKGRTRQKAGEQPNKSVLLKLKQFYQPYNEQFFKLIGEEFDWR